MNILQIVNNKYAYNAISNWLMPYNYHTEDLIDNLVYNTCTTLRENPYTLIDWNKWDSKNRCVKDMFIKFSDPLLELKFILDNVPYIKAVISNDTSRT